MKSLYILYIYTHTHTHSQVCPVSADSVSTVLVTRVSPWLGKNWKIKEINGL
jgi:hypothetical protein